MAWLAWGCSGSSSLLIERPTLLRVGGIGAWRWEWDSWAENGEPGVWHVRERDCATGACGWLIVPAPGADGPVANTLCALPGMAAAP